MAHRDGALGLVERIEQLRQSLLPADFEPTGLYANQDEVDDRTSAFILLCHAEFEEFIEDLARAKTQEALTAWNSGNATTAGMALLAFYYSPDNATRDYSAQKDKNSKRKGAPAKEGSVIPSLSLQFILNKVARSHTHAIDNNNGIKEQNLRELLEPVGIELSNIDYQTIRDLDSFGLKRGSVAHQSMATRQNSDPKIVYRDALDLAKNLNRLTSL